MVELAPIPLNEQSRLEALHSYSLLDTANDRKFDLFARLGTWLFEVPIAAINLVDADRTFFKSLIGLPTYEPKRCTSMCAHAVGSGEQIFVIEDLAADSRFHDHFLVTQKGVRFYAAALLYSDTGHALGTLCIADVKPRLFSAEDRHKLADLAEGVSAVLELHRRGLWLLQAARQDPLTGLCNRRAFEEALQRTVAQSTSDKICALFYLDLDRFKNLNDRFGHSGGDEILREVGRRLSKMVRAGDIAARLGGDEFVLLSANPTSAFGVEQLAQRLLAAFAHPFQLQGENVPILTSVGIAMCPSNATDAAGLLHCADSALYEAKQMGRASYRIYQGSVSTSSALGITHHPNEMTEPTPDIIVSAPRRSARPRGTLCDRV